LRFDFGRNGFDPAGGMGYAKGSARVVGPALLKRDPGMAVWKWQGIADGRIAGAIERHWGSFFLKLAISTLLIVFLAVTYDVGEAFRRLGAIDLPWFFASLLLLGLGVFLAALRWRSILDGIGIALSFHRVLRIVFIGLIFNQALPSSIGGDAMRVWQIHRVVASMGLAFRSIVLDRLAGLAGLVLLVMAAVFLLPRLAEKSTAPVAAMGDAMMGAALAAMAGFVLLLVFDRLPLAFLGARAQKALARIAVEGRQLLLTSWRAPYVLGLSCLIHVFSALSVFCLAQGMGIPLGVVACLVLVPPVILLMVLPISLAGWGVREGAMIAALGLVGVPAGEALVLSIAFGLSVLLASLPGGAVWFLTRSPQKIQREAVEE